MFYPKQNRDANLSPSQLVATTNEKKGISETTKFAATKSPLKGNLTGTKLNVSQTAVDNRPVSSEQLVNRLFKGLGVPLYDSRVPKTYQTEIIPPALKDYRWGAFDLSIYHDTMLTISKPPPTPIPVAAEAPPPPPVVDEATEEPQLLLTNVSSSVASKPSSNKASFSSKMSIKVQANWSESQGSKSMKKTELSVKAISPKSVKVVSPSSQSVKAMSPKSMKVVSPSSQSVKAMSPKSMKVVSPNSQSVKAVSPKSIKVMSPNSQSVKAMSPKSMKVMSPNSQSVKAMSPTSMKVVSPTDQSMKKLSSKVQSVKLENELADKSDPLAWIESILEQEEETAAMQAESLVDDMESEQLIDGLLDLAVSAPRIGKSFAAAKSTKASSKSVKAPLPVTQSSKELNAGQSSESVKPFRKNVDFAALGIEDTDSPAVVSSSTPESAVVEAPVIESAMDKNVLPDVSSKTISLPSDEELKARVEDIPADLLATEESTEVESQLSFLNEAVVLAAKVVDVEKEKENQALLDNSSMKIRPAPVSAAASPENKPYEVKYVSPSDRSVFKPTFAMPRPVAQDPIAALLVNDLQSGKKRFHLQSEHSAATAEPSPLTAGPSPKRKRDGFNMLEEAFLNERVTKEPARAGNMINSDSEGDAQPAPAPAMRKKKGTKTGAKAAKQSPVKQWYMAGAYSSHHEAIDAITRMHKLLAAQSPNKNDSDSLDDKFRLQRDLNRMQWVVECNDRHQKALILSHASRSPVVPEKDKAKYRNIIGDVKDPNHSSPHAPGAGLYHSPNQLQPSAAAAAQHHSSDRDHHHSKAADKHGAHDGQYLRERDAFHEQHMRMIKQALPKEESPPPRRAAEGGGGSRFPPIVQPTAQAKKGKKK